MRGLEQALAELARERRSGDAPNPKAGPESATKSGLLASGDLASGDENAIPPVGADASDDGFFVLSQPPSRRYAPWFPETTASRETAPAASRDEATVSNAPVVFTAPRRPSILADAALEADAAAAAARSVRESRLPKTGKAGARVTHTRRRAEERATAHSTTPPNRRRERRRRSSKRLRERSRARPAGTREARAPALPEKLRASQSGDRPDWEVRLELIEAENERTRLRLRARALGRSAGEAAALEEPKPREASPPQPWR